MIYENFEYKRVSGRGIYLTNEELLDFIKGQWEKFKNINGHYPTTQDIDNDQTMIGSRLILRRFGGLMKLRNTLGMDILNYSAGETRSKSAEKSIALAYNDECICQRFLCEHFGMRPLVVAQEQYLEFDNRSRSDFGVYHKNGHFFVDVFTAKDDWSLAGCINHKMKKLKGLNVLDDIFFVSLNDSLTQDIIDDLVKNKKNKLPKNVRVLTNANFKKLCKKYEHCVR